MDTNPQSLAATIRSSIGRQDPKTVRRVTLDEHAAITVARILEQHAGVTSVPARDVVREIYAHARRSDGEVGRINLSRDDCRTLILHVDKERTSAEKWGYVDGRKDAYRQFRAMPWWRRLFTVPREDS